MLLLCGAATLSERRGKKTMPLEMAPLCAVTTNYITLERSALINIRIHFTEKSSNIEQGDSSLLSGAFEQIKPTIFIK